MTPLRLQWRRPVDGVEVVSPSQGKDAFTDTWRPGTDRFEYITFDRVDLENPVVLQFINCHRSGRLDRFITRFGFPRAAERSVSGEYVHFYPDMDADAEDCLSSLRLSANSTTIGERVRAVMDLLEYVELKPLFDEVDGGRLVLQPRDLMGFMAMEVAEAHEAGAKLTECAHCQKYFLTGPKTNRRSTAIYCSDRCRVAANRARNAEKG